MSFGDFRQALAASPQLRLRFRLPTGGLTPIHLHLTEVARVEKHWATSSTFFAIPAATLARGLTDTFVGLRPADIAPFLLAQLAALGIALLVGRWLRR